MGRKRARDEFFKVMFEADVKGDSIYAVAQNYVKRDDIELDGDEEDFIITYAKKIEDSINEIDSSLENSMKGWKLDRVGVIERVLLRFATYELIKERESVGYNIVVNEVIEIAKKYGDEKTHEFINGVLANIIKEESIK
jgi:transcription antitermination protein NusB